MRWKKYKDEGEVREVIAERLPPGSTPEDVQSFAAAEGLECSGLVDGVIRCSAPAPRLSLLVSAQWLIELQFDGDRLSEVRVERGLTGP